MQFPARQSGLSLFELMIALAITGVLSGLAIPAYRSYIDTANMTRVTANFQNAIKVAQAEYKKRDAMLNLGIDIPTPTSTAGWIDLLNEKGLQAPGGGAAYISSNNKDDGNVETGAIGVKWRKNTRELRMWRPAYSSLVKQQVTITTNSIDLINRS